MLPSLRALVQQARERWIGDSGLGGDELGQKVRGQIRGHLDGMLIGPAMVALARGGVLGRLAQGPVDWRELPGNQASLNLLFDLLETQGWVAWEGEVVRLTSQGTYAAQIATSYGVTVSYLPMFNVLSTLLFGNARFPRVDENGVELLVNRGMNVWGSGGAHTTYFKKVDEIIIEIFNRPIARQPQGICDMGCGDGTFLEHLYEVVKTRTARGGMLDKHPLLLVGADFNKVARRVAKQNCGGRNCRLATLFRETLIVRRSWEAIWKRWGWIFTICCTCVRFWITTGLIRRRRITGKGCAGSSGALLIWERNFLRTSWKKIWCVICGGGRLTWGGSACWFWSCILCRRNWPRRIY